MSYRRTKNSWLVFFPILLLTLLISFTTSAQKVFITGKVVNAADQSALPFVYLRFDGGNNGTTSNIDGKFTLPDSIKQVQFSYIGFKPTTLPVTKIRDHEWLVDLYPDDILLSTIEVYPRKDPAFRIMQSVLDHAAENDPDKLESFQYTSYHKFWLSADDPSNSKLTGKMRISPRELERLQQKFEENHMLLIETLSKKKFLQPNHENEEILSTRVSGLKKEAFFLLATQLQSFSIYNENFSLLSKSYLSPVSKTALKNYAFVLEDTLQTERQDTVYLIRFHPAKDRNVDGLKGFLHINTHGYAVQSVIAEPSNAGKNEISASVWQHYDRLETGQWFPSELNAAINFMMMTSVPADPNSSKKIPIELSVTANSRTYLYQRAVNVSLDLKSFTKYGMRISNEKRDSFINSRGFRYIPLTAKDSSTYVYLDSLGKKARMYQRVKLLHALSLGTIPVGVFNINFMYLLGFNINEGYKFGLGLNTNRKLSKYIASGIYFTYGTRVGEFRHGEWLRIYPTGYPDFTIQLGYRNFKKEYGEEEMLTDYNIFEPEYFRSLLITNMFHVKNYSASVEIRPVEPLNVKAFIESGSILRFPYGNFSQVEWDPFKLTRTGIELRYSPGIAFLNDTEELIQSSPPKSEFYFSAIQGMKLLSSQFQYTKIDTKAKFNLRISATGKTTVMIRGGKIFGNAPITEWFHGYGSYSGAFTLLPHYAFSTMRLNEFSADQYAILHIRHNFGRGFIPANYFIRPEIVLAQNMGFGSLEKKYSTASEATDFRKGYYESGIELNKILSAGIAGFGFGTYYRYGPYAFSTNKLNFAYKFTINFKY
jgi:hypothetical protein